MKHLSITVVGLAFLLFCHPVNAQGMAPMSVPSNIFEIVPAPTSEVLDYHLLYNNTFNQVDIDDAKTKHYSDRQIAKIYKLAKGGGVEFRDVLSLVVDGYSFATLSDLYGVDLRNVQREQDDIDAYESAYAGTGLGNAPRPGRVESSIDSIKHRS